MLRLRLLILSVVMFTTGWAAIAQAGVFEKHCKGKFKDEKVDCGPIYWGWKLPPGNGHYWHPHPCIGPPEYYTPQLPSYYRGPYLRTIEQPIE